MNIADHHIKGIRLAFAFTLALTITHHFNYPNSSWVLISIVIVLTASHESKAVLKKAIHRIVGTISGIVLGALGLLIAHWCFDAAIIYMMIILFIAGSHTKGEYSYIAIICCVTLGVVMSHLDNPDVGLWRGLNVIIGATLGCLISLIPVTRLKSN